MSLKQLMGRKLRLQRELALAYSSLPWRTPQIERVAKDLAATESEIEALQPAEAPAQRGFEPRKGVSGQPR